MPEVVETQGRRESGVLQRVVVPASPNVVSVEHVAFGAAEDELLQAARRSLGRSVVPEEVEEVGGKKNGSRAIALWGADNPVVICGP